MKFLRKSEKRIIAVLISAMVLLSGLGISALQTIPESDGEKLKNLYDEWKDAKSTDYTSSTFSDLTNALNDAKSVIDGKNPSTSLISDSLCWKFAGKNSAGELLNFRNIDEFKTAYPEMANNLPFNITENDGKSTIDFNHNTLGFYYPDSSVKYYGMPMVKYDISDSPITVDFINGNMSVDLQWGISGKPYALEGSVSLFFANIGEWIELKTVAGKSIEGHFEANVNLKDYYDKLDSSSKEKKYLLNNDGKDDLLGVVFRFGNVYFSNDDGLYININKFEIGKILSEKSALENLQNAIDGLVEDTYTRDLVEFNDLYQKYNSVEQGDYTTSSYRNLQETLKSVKGVYDNNCTYYKTTDLTDGGVWKFSGQNSSGELLNFRSAEDFSSYYKSFVDENGLPFLISKSGDTTNILFNKKTIGFYYSQSNVKYWGMPIVKYDFSQSPVRVDFNTDDFEVEVNFRILDYPSQQLPSSISLFFENIGEWIELSSVSSGEIKGNYSAKIDLKKYYDSLESGSTAKKYLDSNAGKDNLIGISYRFSDINFSNNSFEIDIAKFNKMTEITPSDALSQLKKAVEDLVTIGKNEKDRLDNVKKTYEKYKKIQKGNYTDSSYNTLQKALDCAKALLDSKELSANSAENLLDNGYWEYAGTFEGDYSSFYTDDNFLYQYETDTLPTKITANNGGYEIYHQQLGFYGTNSVFLGAPKQRYNFGDNSVSVDFNNDDISFDINFTKKPTKNDVLRGTVVLNFANIGAINVESKLVPQKTLAGKYKITTSLDKIYDTADESVIEYLKASGGVDLLESIEICFHSDSTWFAMELAPVIDVNTVRITHNFDPESIINIMNNAYKWLKKKNSNTFVFDLTGKWYMTDPEAKTEKFIPQKINQSKFGVSDTRNTEEDGYYRLAFLTKGLYEYDDAIGTYKVRYSMKNGANVNFKEDALFVDIHATCVGQQNMDVKFYSDLYFEGYSKPVRLSSLYSKNKGLSQGRVSLTINLCEYLDAYYADKGFLSFLKKNNYNVKIKQVDFSATYNGVVWVWGGESILLRDFSIDKKSYPSAENLTKSVNKLTEKGNFTTVANRFEIQKLANNYKYMPSEEKLKVSSATVKKLNSLTTFVASAEKKTYFFGNIYMDRENWRCTGGANSKDLINGVHPITDSKAYLDYSTEGTDMLIYPTGTSLDLKSFQGGACVGWSNMFYTLEKPYQFSVDDGVIYYDVDSTSDFLVMLNFNDSSNGFAVLSKPKGSYTGYIDIAACVNSLSDDDLRSLGIYNNSEIYITEIRFEQIVNKISDVSLGHFLNIKTLAVSESRSAFLNAGNYHKVSYKRVSLNSGNVSVEVTEGEKYDFNSTVKKAIDAMIYPVKIIKERLSREAVIWGIIVIDGIILLLGALFVVLVCKRGRKAKYND